eukprot:1607290-Pyramimonas_sp.AAC.1
MPPPQRGSEGSNWWPSNIAWRALTVVPWDCLLRPESSSLTSLSFSGATKKGTVSCVQWAFPALWVLVDSFAQFRRPAIVASGPSRVRAALLTKKRAQLGTI